MVPPCLGQISGEGDIMRRHYTNSEARALIAEHVHSERDRRVLERYYIDGIVMEPLAEEEDLSVSTVARIIKRGKRLICE